MAHVIGDVTQSQLTAAVAASVTNEIRENISVRPPSATDDSTKGYAAGALWLTDNGELYECLNATEGKARWYRRNDINASAGDIVAPYRVWAFKRLVATWTGAGVRIRRASDSTELDINFLEDGTLDYKSADEFIVGTTGYVTTIYEQTGSGDHLTQTVAGNQPWFPTVAFLKDGTRGAFFNNEITQGNSTPPDHFMDIPATTQFTNHTLTGFFVTAGGSSLRNIPFIYLAGTNNMTYAQSAQPGVYDLTIRDNSFRGTKAGVPANRRLPISPFVHGFTSAPSANGIYWGDETKIALNGTSYTDTLTATYIGRSPGIVDGGADEDMGYCVYQAIVLYNSALSAANAQKVQAALHKDFGLKPQVRDQVIFDGDSLTEGAYASWFQNIARRYWLDAKHPAHIFNVAASGGTVDTQYAALAQWTDIYRSDRRNIVISGEGSNDLSAGDTAAASYATLATKIAALDALGFDNIGVTVIPRTSLASGAENVELLAFNAYLRANFADIGYSAIIDPIVDDPIFSTASINTNTTYYQSDGTHLTDKGYGVLEQNLVEAITARLEQ